MPRCKKLYRIRMHERLRLISLFFFFFESYDELVSEHKVVYVAGGGAQNAARGAAVSIFS